MVMDSDLFYYLNYLHKQLIKDEIVVSLGDVKGPL